MRVAFITQPRDGIGNNTSLGIITLGLARNLAVTEEVIIYGKKTSLKPGIDSDEKMKLKTFSIGFDDLFIKPALKIFKHFFPGKKLPYFASSFYYLAYALRIAWDCRKLNCDVVHIHNYSQFVPVFRLLNAKAKIILHMNCEWLTQINRGAIQRRLKMADLVLSCSRFVTERNRNAFPEYPDLFFTLYNGVDIKSMSSARRDRTVALERPRKILYVGRVSPEKGIHVLIDAFNQVVEKYPDAELDIVGPPGASSFITELDDDEIVKDLAEFYTKTDYFKYVKSRIIPKAEGQIKFLGAVSHSRQLSDHYRESDIFVFPSVWNEPFGIPVAEAMASGLPVITTRSGGIPEIVENGKYGFLVNRNDTEQLVYAFMYLLKNASSLKGQIQGAMERSEKVFAWENISGELLEYYKKEKEPKWKSRFIGRKILQTTLNLISALIALLSI